MTQDQAWYFISGFLSGFMAAGEGFNGEYPFLGNMRNVSLDAAFKAELQKALDSCPAYVPENDR